MVTALEYRHVPTGTLAILGQQLGKVCASPSTWYQLVRKFGWRRPAAPHTLGETAGRPSNDASR
jgi:hypothetical protein